MTTIVASAGRSGAGLGRAKVGRQAGKLGSSFGGNDRMNARQPVVANRRKMEWSVEGVEKPEWRLMLQQSNDHQNVQETEFSKQLREKSQRNATQYLPERKARPEAAPWLVDPRTSKWVAYWDLAVAVALIFTATLTPYEVAFLPPAKAATDGLFIFNRLIDLAFIMDLGLQACPARVLRVEQRGRERARATISHLPMTS